MNAALSPENSASALEKSIKGAEDYKYAMEESFIVAITDQKGIITYANDNFCKISKYRLDELIGQDHRIINSGFHSKEFMCSLWATIANGKIWRGELKNKAKDGTYYWVDTTIVPFLNAQGKPCQYLATRADITTRKATEDKLVQIDLSLKEAQAIAHIGNWEIDLLNKSEIWSDELYEILGVEKRIVPSMELFLSLIHPDDFKSCQEIFGRSENNSIDYRLLLNGGIIKYVSNKWRLEFDKNNKPMRVYGVLQDITERKLAELEHIKLVNDLMTRNAELEQFTYVISHNLRAPVANIIGASSALDDLDLTEADKKTLCKGINTAVKKLDDVIKDLNYILQVKNEINRSKEKVNFSEMVNEIKAGITEQAFTDDVEIKFDFKLVNEFFTLKPYLYSIFYNLISNSIKYRKKHIPCIIEIKSRIVNNNIELIFTDNGMGIDLKKKGEQVFGLYKRFHPDIEGKGMGLFMVKTEVEILGGEISVQSKVNKGTEFIIRFAV